MSSKKVSWANNHGKKLVNEKSVSPTGSSRKVPMRKGSVPIAPQNMSHVLQERYISKLHKIKLSLEKCKKDILELQKKCDYLIKLEDHVASNTSVNIATSVFLLTKLDNNMTNNKNEIKNKKLLMRQLKDKKVATSRYKPKIT